jgi:hypothetical protein
MTHSDATLTRCSWLFTRGPAEDLWGETFRATKGSYINYKHRRVSEGVVTARS